LVVQAAVKREEGRKGKFVSYPRRGILPFNAWGGGGKKVIGRLLHGCERGGEKRLFGVWGKGLVLLMKGDPRRKKEKSSVFTKY